MKNFYSLKWGVQKKRKAIMTNVFQYGEVSIPIKVTGPLG